LPTKATPLAKAIGLFLSTTKTNLSLLRKTYVQLVDWHISGFWVVNKPVAGIRLANYNPDPGNENITGAGMFLMAERLRGKNVSHAPTLEILDPQQEQLLQEFAARCLLFQKNESIEKSSVEEAIRRRYVAHQLSAPPIVWAESPWQLICLQGIFSLLTCAEKDELLLLLKSNLTSPLWRRLWNRLDQQLESNHDLSEMLASTTEHTTTASAEILLGDSFSGRMNHALSAAMKLADPDIGNLLGIRVKLRLRDALHSELTTRQPALLNERLALAIRALVPLNPGAELAGQISPEALAQVEALWSRRMIKPDRDPPNWAGDIPHWRLLPNTSATDPPLYQIFSLWYLPTNLQLVPGNGLAVHGFICRYLSTAIDEKVKQTILDFLVIKENAFDVHYFEKLCIICEPPLVAHLNERRRLHNADGPALVFNDDLKIYASEGVMLPPDLIECPEKLTLSRIDSEPNVEVRRLMIQRYGLERYLRDADAVEIDSDECGILYRKTLPQDEPIVVVKVIDSTAAPDGSRRQYFLRVPPHISSARAAVAWTFGMSAAEYNPLVQA
jgi:hypothetical protein